MILGASGDLTKRLLMPAIYNLACEGLLPDAFAVVGMAMTDLTTEEFRCQQRQDLARFSTRATFDEERWAWLASRLHYTAGEFADAAAYDRLRVLVEHVREERSIPNNTLIYLAISPHFFAEVNRQLAAARFTSLPGAKRIIVEKPFGSDLESARTLNRELLEHWDEEEIFRIDHYLGKETVQNLLAFRLANPLFTPLWNAEHIDHIQISALETVGVETRGGYYDRTGVLRDMVQNHLLQMLAYVCMELPRSLDPAAIRDAKSQLLEAVRPLDNTAIVEDCVRGQYGAGVKADGTPAVAYRNEPAVTHTSNTETFAAITLHIDNERWRGVPLYLRSGKAMWKRGTEIVIQFRASVGDVGTSEPNLLIFHIQPFQGVEIRVHAKRPGPQFHLQAAGMRFDYAETFEAARGTGYEVLLYAAFNNDPTLFSRTDFVETAWGIVQPLLDAWQASSAEAFPNYAAGSWGPRAASTMLARKGRQWHESLTRDVLTRSEFLKHAPAVMLNNLLLAFRPVAFAPGETIVQEGACGGELFFVCRGSLEVLRGADTQVGVIGEGEFFGEVAVLFNQPRTATVRALQQCDLLALDADDFHRIAADFPQMTSEFQQIAASRISRADRG